MQAIFWTALFLLSYTFAGYPILMRLLAKLRTDHLHQDVYSHAPKKTSISVIIAAHNETDKIKDRITNLLATDFDHEQLEIIVVSDGCDDDTARIAKSITHPCLKVIELAQRHGKAACINIAVNTAQSDILVFSDSRQSFASDALTELALPFADPDIVGVGGELHITPSGDGALSALDNYWNLERQLRSDESRFRSLVGCTGAIYAIRANTFTPIDASTILDDVVIPMQATKGGGRVIFNRAARAFDPQPLNSSREKARKTRTLAGNFQLLFHYPQWLAPWGHPQWWQLISHKHLRILAPALMLICAITNVALFNTHQLYAVLGGAQLALYSLAALGLSTRLSKFRAFAIPASFMFLNAMSILGFSYFLSSYKKKGWE
ncbi:MAG: glycosyltransferase family 2 protein [Verrucomicrobiaceae bacterium]|nr:glycosyltransferase family 2 protein [Verrucomicrobiaceae bacterium]